MIDSYVIIKSKDNDNDDENNAQNKDKNKKIITIKKTTTKNKYNNNEWNTYNRQNTYREGEKKKLIYYIQTMKRLLCLILSVNITFRSK